jgi:hypothetical protein
MLINLARNLEGVEAVAMIRTSAILYPLISAMHIIGIATLFGAILTLDLRAAGIWKSQGWRGVVGTVSPVAAAGLLLTTLSGALLFVVRGSHYVLNSAFLIKLAIVTVAIANVVVFHSLLAKCSYSRTTLGIRVCAIVSIVAWISAIVAGRWIAFAM